MLSHSPKLGDSPCTRDLIAPFAPPTTAPAAITTSTHLWHIDHRPLVLLYYCGRTCIEQGGGTAPYRPLCSVLYRGGDGSVPSPVVGFM